MSPRTVSQWVRTGVALAVVACVQSGSALAQGAETSPSSRRPTREAAHGGAPDATTAIDCGADGAAAFSCVGRAPDGGITDARRQAVSGVLTLRAAIQRALEHNLTILGFTHAIGEQRGQQRIARSQLLPNITGEFSALEQRLNLAAVGVRIDVPVPGFVLEHGVGPFWVLDSRMRLSQALVDIPALRTHRATSEAVRASELSLGDARDLITLAVGRAYLQAQAARARVDASRAQVETAKAIHDKAVQQQAAGLATPLDANRAHVQVLTAEQRLAALEADYAKQKIDLTRISGLPPTDGYDLDQSAPFSPAPQLPLEQALQEATQGRADLQAAEAQVRAAELSLSASRAQRLPTLSLRADYGVSRAEDRSAVNTYAVAGLVSVPLWEGGRIDGQIENAVSVLNRRRAERDDLRAQIEADVRKAFVDLQAAETAVRVAELNGKVTRETLGLTRQRFDAGVSDNVAVVQSQESMATADFDYIDSVLIHNLAKLDLARAIGRAAENIERFLQLSPAGR